MSGGQKEGKVRSDRERLTRTAVMNLEWEEEEEEEEEERDTGMGM
jgi:hypothetical protein